ncbi:MAG: PIN domain-containing protein [Microbacteriaceae bacterium]|nr:MAG: PIN domain-containing protein [Microbacteriaceae bacterium]
MIGVDTNVLVRHATQDDPLQSAIASTFLATLDEDNPGFISLVTMVETVWVLQRAYHASAEVVDQFVNGVLNARELSVQEPDIVRRAARMIRAGGADFADAVIGLAGAAAGCDYTVTFDLKASRLPGLSLLE